MKLKLKSSLLLIILSIIFYSCEKEYSVEGNLVGGTAIFTMDGSPGSCTNAVVTGTYQVGTALDSTNVVTISVDVTFAGTYTIATATINGISFSGSGTFPGTGPQIISLTGTGTPDTPGTLSFTPGTSGCSFPVTISGSGGTSVYTFAGAPGNCTGFTPGGTYAAGTTLDAGNFASLTVDVTTLGTYSIATNTVNGISFSATGTFTTTGTQVIQLNGSGTPIAGGTFDFIPGTNGCMFSITVTGSSNGSAVFTYDGGTGPCTSVTSGTYTTGTALTASNIVIIDINVTTIGTYSISTQSLNGFSFSGSGSFTVTGTQSITLTGTGTPLVAGVFEFTPTNNGCTFPITVFTGTPVTDFINCTIDGIAKTFNVDLLGEKITSDTFDISGSESSAANSPVFAIRLTRSPIAIDTYDRYLSTNTAIFCLAGYNDGVTQTSWLTGQTLQTTGFTVIVTDFTTSRIEGTFSGTIYSDPVLGTGPIVITNGQFSVPY